MTPRASCQFNPTEQCWRVIKGRYRAQLTKMAAEKPITQLQFFVSPSLRHLNFTFVQVLVNQAYRSVTNRLMRHLLNDNDDYIRRMIEGDF